MFSKLVKDISPFYVMDILEQAQRLERSGKDVVHFEVGEPDFITPSEICESAVESINQGRTKYTSSLGIEELRMAISDDYRKTYGVDVDYERVIVTLGSSPGLLMAMLSVIDPGDEILITDPYYACYPQIISVARGVTKKIPVYEENDYQIDTEIVKKSIGPRTKALLINSPSNPTGSLLNNDILEELSKLNIMIISDEIYHGLVYEEKESTILEFSDTAVVVSGFSKLYSMTGWRLGYVIVPPNMVRYIQKLQQNLFISANPFVQSAGISALEHIKPKADHISSLFNQRRKEMADGLKSIGLDFTYDPKGAFYIFVNSGALSNDSHKLAYEILENTNVAVTPGIDFSDRGEKFLRFSYATSVESIREGIKRLKAYI